MTVRAFEAWDFGVSAVSKAVDIVQQETPLVIEVILFVIHRKTYSEGFAGVAGLLGRYGSIISIMAFFAMSIVPRMTTLAKITFAPRIYLIEYAVEVFKK